MRPSLFHFRIDLDSDVGREFERLMKRLKDTRSVVEMLLTVNAGIEAPVPSNMSDGELYALREAVSRLNSIADILSSGVSMSPTQQIEEVRKAISPRLTESLRKSVKPGMRPGGGE